MSDTLVLSSRVLGLRAIGAETILFQPRPAQPRDDPPAQVDIEAIKNQVAAQVQAETRKQVTAELQAAFQQQLGKQRAKDQQQIAQQDERCRTLGKHITDFIERTNDSVGAQVIGTALKLTELILRHALPDRTMLESLLKDTLEPVADLQGVIVRMAPDDAAFFKKKALAGPVSHVEIQEDASLQTGDMMVETRNGLFNAKLDERLAQLAKKLDMRRKELRGDGRTP